MSDQIHTYTEHQAILLEVQLRKQIRAALRRQHPEWTDANGKSPLCDSYEARLTELLVISQRRKTLEPTHHLRSSPH